MVCRWASVGKEGKAWTRVVTETETVRRWDNCMAIEMMGLGF